MDKAEEFLREKKMLKHSCKHFIISGDFGATSLNDLLNEYANKKVQEALIGFEKEWKDSTALAPRRSAKDFHEELTKQQKHIGNK